MFFNVRELEYYCFLFNIQDSKTKQTSGSTVFSLFSHLGRKPFGEWRTIQPILSPGDMIAFQGNLFHYGGSFLLNPNQCHLNERLVIYGVFHLCNHVKSLVNDPNIDALPDSLFGGNKFHVNVHGTNIEIVGRRSQLKFVQTQ